MDENKKKLGVFFNTLFEALERDQTINPLDKRVVREELNDIKDMFLEGRHDDLQKTFNNLVKDTYDL